MTRTASAPAADGDHSRGVEMASLRRFVRLGPGRSDSIMQGRQAQEVVMGDKGKKDKDKDQKQHAAKHKQEDKRKLEKQPKRPV